MNIGRVLACVLFTCSGLVACGGAQKNSKSPESSSGITETSTKEDMPPAEAKEAATPASMAGTDTVTPALGDRAAGGMIKLAAMKLTSAKKGKKADKPIELKADGTVLIDGKPAAKVKGDQVDSIGGTSMLTVGVDGSLVGNGVKPGFKFEGDELTTESGLKLAVGDEGAITVTKDGKSEVIGKAEGGAAAKRAALIATVLWMTIPTTVGAETAKKAGPKSAAPAKKK